MTQFDNIGRSIPTVSKGKVGGAFVAAVMAILMGVSGVSGLIPTEEGKTNVAVIPVPGDVPTICYGETNGVQMGDTATDSQCAALLRSRLVIVFNQMAAVVTAPMTVNQGAAFADFVYNEGIGTFKRSSILRDFNAGRTSQACDDLLKYDIAGGRRLRGLTRRREAERVLCLKP